MMLDIFESAIDNENLNKLNSNRTDIVSEGNVAIIGSRGFTDYSYAEASILDILHKNDIKVTKIISGGARGADKLAEMFASKYSLPIEVIKPDWNIGRHAGMLRNTDIISKSNIVIAFWDGKSKGTSDSIYKAKLCNRKLFR